MDTNVPAGQENTPDLSQAGEQILHSPRRAKVSRCFSSFHAVQIREDFVKTRT